jgi:LysM repeat protein
MHKPAPVGEFSVVNERLQVAVTRGNPGGHALEPPKGQPKSGPRREAKRVGRNRWGMAFGLAAAAVTMTAPAAAHAEVAHVVQPGETLWSISAANNLTTRTVAVYNGLPEDAQVVVGQTVNVPTVEEGAAALAAAGTTTSSSSSGTSSATSGGVEHVVQPGETLTGVAAVNGIAPADLAAANGLAADAYLIAGATITIPSASGTTASSSSTSTVDPVAELAPEAAASWSAMRAEAQSVYGIDLYPSEGPLSVYRTYEEQAHLYDLYLNGKGAPANPPGSSSHELGLAVDLAEPEMRSVIDEIGGNYGWVAPYDSEWWHVEYWG